MVKFLKRIWVRLFESEPIVIDRKEEFEIWGTPHDARLIIVGDILQPLNGLDFKLPRPPHPYYKLHGAYLNPN